MAGYNDTRNLIIEALMGRQAGTEIQPEKHQAYALNMLDYVRSVELVSSSTLVGLAEESTVPVQPDQGKVCYIAGVGQDRTVTFSNFIDDEGNPISITTGEMEGVFVILLWNMEHWTAYTFNTNIISSAEAANFYYGYNIRKTYASVAAMNADSVNPIGTDGRLIKIGELVTVVNSTTPSENGFYSYEGSENGWLLQSGFSFEIVQTTGTDINKTMSQKAVTDELELKAAHGYDAEETPKTLKEVDTSVVQLAGETNILSKKIINTKVGGGNLFDSIRGENDTVINVSGILVTAINWYTSPLIPWGEETQAIIDKSRSWAQYDSDGNVTSNWYNSTTSSISQTLSKDLTATHFRTSTGTSLKGTVMVNYGNVQFPFENFHLEITDVDGVPVKTYLSSDERIKEMLLSESFMPSAATYTEGLIDSPFNVIWADGVTGQFTLTRNTDNLVTKIIATYSDKIATCNITRDINGNVINQTITITIA